MITQGLLWETCTVARKSGTNGNGQPTYGSGVPARCGITRKTKTIKTTGGTDIQSTAQVSLPVETTIEAQDKITLPEGTALIVQDVATVTGAYGQISHRVAFL